MSTEQAMKQKPVVTWKGWLALLIMCCMFSGLFTGFEGALKPLNVLDFNTMVGSFGVDADGVNFQGKNGTGARDGFMFTITLVPGCIFAMGFLEVLTRMGCMEAAQVAFTPILKPILGIPGACGLAFINALNSSDIAAVLTKQLYDDGMITDDERSIFVAYQYAGSAPIGNMIGTQAALLPIISLAMGPMILLIIVCKIFGANLLRIYLKMTKKSRTAKEAK